MKTLKKTLCLVLAVVMVVGVLVLPASAAADAATNAAYEKKYNEAVEVLKAIGVMKGDEGGFRGGDTITRAEAAAVVTRMALGDESAKDYPTDNLPFEDVDAGAWYASYIAYCYDNDIVGGDDGISFRPEDDVTGYEFAKMVLVVLGNDANDYSGDKWTSNVSKDLRAAGLNEGITGITWNDPIKRGEVAQLALNGIMAPGGVTQYIVYSGDSVEEAEEIFYRGTNWSDAMLFAQSKDAKVATNDIGSLAAVVFDNLRKSDVAGEDLFGRPTVKWITNSDDDLVEIAKTADATYDDGITGKDAKKLAEKDYTVYYNGQEGGLKNEADTENGSGLYIDDSTGILGFEVEVFDADERIIVKEAYYTEIGKAAEEGADITVTVHRAGQTEGKTITVTKDDEAYADVAANQGKTVAAYVNFTDEVVIEIAALEVVENVTVTRRDVKTAKFDSAIYVGTTKYAFNNQALVKSVAGVMTYLGVLNTIDLYPSTLYLHNGRILFVDQSETETTTDPNAPTAGYAYFYDVKQVKGAASTSGTDNKWDSEGGNVATGSAGTADTFIARLLLADKEGTIADGVTVEIKDNDSAAYEDFEEILGTLVFYTVDDETGVYTIESIKGVAIGEPTTQVNEENYDTAESGTLNITNKKSEATIPGKDADINVAFDSATVFIVVSTGLNNKIPNFKVTSGNYDIYGVPSNKSTNAIVTAMTAWTVDEESNEAQIGATPTDKQIPAVVLIVDSSDPAEPDTDVTEGIFFILKDENATEIKMFKDLNGDLTVKPDNDNIIYYVEYDAVIDGELTTVYVLVDLIDEFDENGYVLKKAVETQTWNGVTVITDLGDDADALGFTEVTEYKNDHVKLNGEQTADYLVSLAGGKVYGYNTDTGRITVEELKEGEHNGLAVINDAHTVLTAIFLDVTEAE